jgi:hypothetical protein
MSPVHATKAKRRYRYYVTRQDALDGARAWRVPAYDLEALVCGATAEFLLNRQELSELLLQALADPQAVQQALAAAKVAAGTLRTESAAKRAFLLERLIQLVTLEEKQILITISPSALLRYLGFTNEQAELAEAVVIRSPAVRVRRGHDVRLVIPSATPPAKTRERDEKLVALVTEAQVARGWATASPEAPLSRIAAEQGRCRTRLSKLLAISCLAPHIVTAIIEGRQPASLTAAELLRTTLPLACPEQRAILGLA